ncbi:MAG: hypothetical protein J0H61_06785, partial [Alphaproteobacteria bacterium]|nr:hypothetical protein [Alphaproteobacteria bacterium]
MATILSEQLAPLRARLAGGRTAVRPVSRVSFEVSDKAAFARCIELSNKWMASRAQVQLPAEAWAGKSFDITDILGANPTRAVGIEAVDGSVWAARLDWPDPNYPRTWVSEFFTEHRLGEMTRFGAQLTCVIRGDAPSYDITRPTLVRHILEALAAECDGWTLTDHAKALSMAELSEFAELLYNPDRKLPIIAVSGDENGKPSVSPDEVARHIGGAAHIIFIPPDVTWGLTKLIGKRLSVFNGAARLYMPGLTEENEDAFQHPLWMKASINEGFVKMLAARVLPMRFLRDSEEQFIRYSTLRDITSVHSRTTQSTNTLADVKVDFDNLKLSYREMTEERDTWQSLAQEEQSQRLEAEASVERLQEEMRRLEIKANTLEYHL